MFSGLSSSYSSGVSGNNEIYSGGNMANQYYSGGDFMQRYPGVNSMNMQLSAQHQQFSFNQQQMGGQSGSFNFSKDGRLTNQGYEEVAKLCQYSLNPAPNRYAQEYSYIYFNDL